jgi:prolyl-tRNA editing enzyme YbaK/EbsC (Cys-tRNA(Pro) deacylase)
MAKMTSAYANKVLKKLNSDYILCLWLTINKTYWKQWAFLSIIYDEVKRMINAKVKEFLDIKGFGDRLTEHAETIDTVEHAAQQIGCTEPEIAKTLSFIVENRPVIVVMAGDGKVNSSKFKSVFHTKPHMIPRDQVEDITGFQPGGVCPFAVPAEIPIWLDVSMKRFEYVHPAGGNEFTSVKITPDELEEITETQGWCDVCKGWEEEE